MPPIPPLGPALPTRGNAVSRALGRALLRGLGWRIEGALPDVPKFVGIVAPHTSNWDFVVGYAAVLALGLRVSYIGKDALFKPPLGWLMRYLGGIPVVREQRQGLVGQMVDAFAAREQLVLGIAPEGTRKAVAQWKTGFYHIALGAGVPIVPVGLDGPHKTLRLGPPLTPTGDLHTDLPRLQAFFLDL